MAGGIFAAAVHEWDRAATGDTLVASLACVATLAVTAASSLYAAKPGRRLSATFLHAHAVVDVLLVTVVVHLTGGLGSPFAALYVLATVVAALLLPARGGFLVAALALAAYLADGLLFSGAEAPDASGWLQFAVLVVVAAISTAIGARLRELGAGREELAAELVQFRARAGDILRTIRSGILTVDRQGRLLYANPAAGALLGLDLASAATRDILPILAQVAPELGDALARGIAGGDRTNRGEGRITVGDRSFPVGVTTTVSHADDGVTVTAIFQDISESKRAEALHVRAERLEGVAALGAALAHEIRNPLASIRSAVEQLAAVPHAGDDERTLGALIVRESDRLSRLLGDFLDFSRVRVARLAPVDLALLVDGAVALVRAHPDCAGVGELHVAAAELPHVEGDEDLLHRAVFNLVLNAVQAARAGSRVSVEIAMVESDALSAGIAFDDGAVALRVSNSGAPIAADMRERLFDPFTTTRAGGTGLGLAVVQRAVDAHRGVVLVDSDERLTQFTVILPVHQHAEWLGDVPASGDQRATTTRVTPLASRRVTPAAPAPARRTGTAA